MSGRARLREIKSFISSKLLEAKLGHADFSEHKTKHRQMSEGETISQAINDIADKLEIPPCEVCGGKVIFIDQSMGGGLKCIGYPIDDDGSYHFNNGCGSRYYILDHRNPVSLRRIL